MAKYDRNYEGFTNVAGDSLATLDMRVGGIHLEHILNYKVDGAAVDQATIEANVKTVKFSLEGTEQFQLTPAQIFAIDHWHGNTFVNGRIPIRFAKRHREEFSDRIATAIGLDGIQTIYEVQLDRLVANGGSIAGAPSLEFKHVSYNSDGGQGTGLMNGIYKKVIQITGASEKEVLLDIPFGDQVEHIHIFSNVIDEAELWLGGERRIRGSVDELNALYADGDFVPQAGVVHLSEIAVYNNPDDRITPDFRKDEYGNAIGYLPLKLVLKTNAQEADVVILTETLNQRR